MTSDISGAPKTADVAVYGLQRRDRVRGLIDQLATIPCVPHSIFRVDRMGRLLAIYDSLQQDRTLYVRVLSWTPEVRIEWTLKPATFGYRVRSQADKSIQELRTTIRARVMTYELDLDRHAKLTVDACKNGV